MWLTIFPWHAMVGYLLILIELYGFQAIFPFNKTGRDKFGKQVYNYTGSLEDIEFVCFRLS